jgi:hypothetical protein
MLELNVASNMLELDVISVVMLELDMISVTTLEISVSVVMLELKVASVGMLELGISVVMLELSISVDIGVAVGVEGIPSIPVAKDIVLEPD